MKTLMCLGLVLLVAPVFAATDIGPVQSLEGRVWTVDVANKEVTVKDSSGVPFDFMVEPSTRIKSRDKTLTFSDLLSADQVTVKFAPERKGDIAESIQVRNKI